MFLKCKERRNTGAQERETRIACPSLVYSAHQHPTPTVLYFSLLPTGALRRSI